MSNEKIVKKSNNSAHNKISFIIDQDNLEEFISFFNDALDYQKINLLTNTLIHHNLRNNSNKIKDWILNESGFDFKTAIKSFNMERNSAYGEKSELVCFSSILRHWREKYLDNKLIHSPMQKMNLEIHSEYFKVFDFLVELGAKDTQLIPEITQGFLYRKYINVKYVKNNLRYKRSSNKHFATYSYENDILLENFIFFYHQKRDDRKPGVPNVGMLANFRAMYIANHSQVSDSNQKESFRAMYIANHKLYYRPISARIFRAMYIANHPNKGNSVGFIPLPASLDELKFIPPAPHAERLG